MDLVIGDISTNQQFDALRRYYAPASKGHIRGEGESYGEIGASETRGDKASKVAGVCAVKPADPVCHNIHEYAS